MEYIGINAEDVAKEKKKKNPLHLSQPVMMVPVGHSWGGRLKPCGEAGMEW